MPPIHNIRIVDVYVCGCGVSMPLAVQARTQQLPKHMTKSSIKMKTSSIFLSRSHHNSHREHDNVHRAPTTPPPLPRVSDDIVIFCSCSRTSYSSFVIVCLWQHSNSHWWLQHRRKTLLACHHLSLDALANYKSHLKSLNMHAYAAHTHKPWEILNKREGRAECVSSGNIQQCVHEYVTEARRRLFVFAFFAPPPLLLLTRLIIIIINQWILTAIYVTQTHINYEMIISVEWTNDAPAIRHSVVFKCILTVSNFRRKKALGIGIWYLVLCKKKTLFRRYGCHAHFKVFPRGKNK